MVSGDGFRRAMRQLASGVCVIATRTRDDKRCGLTATAVTSLTADPPSLLVCINKSTWLGSEIERSGRFSVNLIGHAQAEVGKAFAGMTGHVGEERFAVGRWRDGHTGIPVLADATGAFECRVDQVVRRDTHLVVFGLVEAIVEGDGPGLIYADGDFGICAPVSV